MRRTFIAVRVEAGEKLKDAISLLKSELKDENIRWVELSNMHITLAFIGSTGEPVIKNVCSMLKDDFAGFGDIEFNLSGLGVFGNISAPRILYAGIENCERLAAAQEIVKNGLKSLGVNLEERQFKPHLTIGKIKDIRDKSILPWMIQKYSGAILQTVNVSEVIYYESVLLPTGPLYKPLANSVLSK